MNEFELVSKQEARESGDRPTAFSIALRRVMWDTALFFLYSFLSSKICYCLIKCAGERFGDLNVNNSIIPVKLLSLTLLSGAMSISTAALAEDEIIVTANRIAKTADETLASVTVITREDIEQRQVHSVQDLLAGTAGISVVNNGGLGKNTSIFMRGTESGHILVLVDGIKVGSATNGQASFQHIPVDQIERIEIVRGPKSSLYGSEALGGVIQIFTRKGGEGFTPSFSVGAGSHDTYNATASLSGGTKKSWFNATLTGLDTQGINACDGSSTEYAGCFTEEPDKDGYNEYSGSFRVGYRLDNGAEFELHGLQSKGETEFDGASQNEADVVQQVLGGNVSVMPTDIWNTKLSIGHSEDKSDTFKDGVFATRFDTSRDSASWQNDIALGENIVVLGVDYQQDNIDSSTDYDVDSRDNVGLFGQYLMNVKGHDIELSARNDDNEQFGNHSTGSVAWGYQLNDSLRLVASYGTAFSAPTFNDLYFPEDAFSKGNPDLEPEESKSYELGLRFNHSNNHFELNVFRTDIDNLINWDSDPVTYQWSPSNLNSSRILGLEAVYSTKVSGVQLNSSLTLLDPESRSDDDTNGNELARRAKESLRIDIDRPIGDFGVGATLIAEGSRYDDLANTRELAGYGVMDLRAEYRFLKDWSLQAKIENAFDKSYETASYFNQLGRGYYVTLNYRPGNK